jgi:hypothetical protein
VGDDPDVTMMMTAPQSPVRGHVSGPVGFAGAAGARVSVLMLSGCPGTLDVDQFKTGGTRGNPGSGGGNPTGGSTGTGGTAVSCTGGNDGVTILNMNCATVSCHIPGAVNDGTAGGLDLTPDSNIASRLVDVVSMGTPDNGSKCMGNPEPYLEGGISPATGLLIDKFTMPHPPCGDQMPAAAPMPLNATQQTCLIQWATTLTSP